MKFSIFLFLLLSIYGINSQALELNEIQCAYNYDIDLPGESIAHNTMSLESLGHVLRDETAPENSTVEGRIIGNTAGSELPGGPEFELSITRGSQVVVDRISLADLESGKAFSVTLKTEIANNVGSQLKAFCSKKN